MRYTPANNHKLEKLFIGTNYYSNQSCVSASHSNISTFVLSFSRLRYSLVSMKITSIATTYQQ